LIICASTSGRLHTGFEKRSEVLQLEGDLKPDMASLTLSSLNFNHMASVNEPEVIVALAEEMKARGIKPELEIFDLGMANFMKYLIRKKVLEPPYYANIILGNIACAQLNLSHIGCILQDLPEETIVSLGGVGDAQFQANALAIAMGYGVRVGMEDNFWFDAERTVLAKNETLLQRIAGIIRACEGQPMSPAELRTKLGLQPGHGAYGLG
jgi:3-keto-5-aminohexanoate cleavage enzyme